MATRKNSSKASNGAGSIFTYITKSGEQRWKVQVTIGRNSKGGVRRTTRTALTYREAQKILRELNHAKDHGRLTQISAETIFTLGRRWVQEKHTRIRPATATSYEDILRLYVNPTIGTMRVVDVKPVDIENMMRVIGANGKSATTINAARRILHGLFTYAMKQGIISYNPVTATDTVRRRAGDKTQVKKPWTLEETTTVLEATIQHELMDCFIHIMLYCGLRPGEALGLRWEDIDLDREVLHVTGTLREERRTTPEGQGVVRLARYDPKNASSRRQIPLQPEVVSALERQRKRQAFWKIVKYEKWADSGYVHTTNIGTSINHSNNRKTFYKFLAVIGVRRIRVHDLRHVVAVLSLEEGIPIEQVSQGLGHTRIDTTKQIYAGHVQKLNDRWAQGVGNIYGESLKRRQTQHLEHNINVEDI